MRLREDRDIVGLGGYQKIERSPNTQCPWTFGWEKKEIQVTNDAIEASMRVRIEECSRSFSSTGQLPEFGDLPIVGIELPMYRTFCHSKCIFVSRFC